MKQHQSGSVLAISLVLLTMITIIALMGLQRSGLQNKIVANIQHKELVFRQSSFIAEDELLELNNSSDANLRSELTKAQAAYYANKLNSNAPKAYTYPRQDSLNGYNNKATNSAISLLFTYSKNTKGATQANNSGASRSLNLAGNSNYEIIADTQIPNGMQSAFAIGFLPELNQPN